MREQNTRGANGESNPPPASTPSWDDPSHVAGVVMDDNGRPGDRYAMDADLTLYWPTVRPEWEER